MAEHLDATQRKMRGIVYTEIARAHDVHAPVPEPHCVCEHGNSAHHGKDGELHCGEDGCDCKQFEAYE